MSVRYVMVRFADEAKVPYRDGVELLLPALLKAPWNPIATEFPHVVFRRVFAVDDAKPTGQAPPHPDDDPPDPYFQVQFPDADSARRFLSRLNELGPAIIAHAYVRGPIRAAHGTPGGRGNGSQAYFMPAPRGIDAAVIWDEYDCLGEGVTVAQVDFGWYPRHDDLPPLDLVFGHNDLALASHGTAVLGILKARAGGPGMRGGAPEASVRTGSVWITNLTTDDGPEALRRARKFLEPGGIILLEADGGVNDDYGIVSPPAEADPILFGEIQRCAKGDILVISPAGNSAANLHVLGEPPDPRYSLMVGACAHDGEGGHLRWEQGKASSNYGKWVNCFAWGHDIFTLGVPPGGTMKFEGTSGAAAIVAVAAILLQSIARRQFAARGDSPGYLTPEQLCGYLTTNGTKIDDHDHPMGVMPDLKTIVEKFLEKFPAPSPVLTAAMHAVKGRKGKAGKSGKTGKSVPVGVVRKK